LQQVAQVHRRVVQEAAPRLQLASRWHRSGPRIDIHVERGPDSADEPAVLAGNGHHGVMMAWLGSAGVVAG
jgi:hypothetical protein